jgi:hypothetical protein
MLEIGISPAITLAMKTQRGKAGPPRVTDCERRHQFVGIPVNPAEKRGVRAAAGLKPSSVRARGVLEAAAKGKK